MDDTISITQASDVIRPGGRPGVRSSVSPAGETSGDAASPAVPSQIDWRTLLKPLILIVVGFLLLFFLPMEQQRFTQAVFESLALAKWYAREHVLLCLVPAFFIAGAVAVFVSQGAVMKYLGEGANKVLSYGVASVSGTILAVCSWTVLPLFAGIWKRGAGLGPAIAFLYSGPAINILAIILTARVLGPELGVARAVGAIVFSVVIGLIMHFMFRKEEAAEAAGATHMPAAEVERPLWQIALLFVAMIGLLIFATLGQPANTGGLWAALFSVKWLLVGGLALALGVMMVRWMGVKPAKRLLATGVVIVLGWVYRHQPLVAFSAGLIAFVMLLTTTRGETESWFIASWDFAKQMLPLLLAGVLVAGLLLGRPGAMSVHCMASLGQRDTLTPSYEGLPRANCRACGEPTCMVFAMRMAEGVKAAEARRRFLQPLAKNWAIISRGSISTS